MKIILTRVTGFIGSHFINRAHKMGQDVLALRRTGSNPRVPLHSQPNWLDASMDGEFNNCFKDVDVFVHLAAHTANYPYDNLENCLYWNLTAPIRLIRQAAEQGVKKFIIAGSCFEYGSSANKVEELTVDSPLEANNNYSISKAASSIAFLGMARQLEIQMKLLRIFQVYGDGEHESRLWPSLKKAALSGADLPMTLGEQIRDFIPVETVAALILNAATDNSVQNLGPEVKHIATGAPQKTVDFVNYWWSRWGATGKIIFGALPYRRGEMMRIISAPESIFK